MAKWLPSIEFMESLHDIRLTVLSNYSECHLVLCHYMFLQSLLKLEAHATPWTWKQSLPCVHLQVSIMYALIL